MLKTNNKGFILLEMIVSLALLTMLTSILVPIMIQLKLEQTVLVDRIEIYHNLYNTIQTIEAEQLPMTDTEKVADIEIKLEFYLENDLIIGQGVWINAKEQAEQATVYFQPVH
ncbi:prepilin-type N-terminal cleavage/methylation domain-containing protein [Amphibacillus sp. Q70]|uniref:prepilin-type N-terminal cleavage/methylation domain-containing protein n=1 Tax=Amphibacillus sp. Q70 TaxID=3453416 RepID=UPI003F8421BA